MHHHCLNHPNHASALPPSAVAGKEWDVHVALTPKADGWYELLLHPGRAHKDPLEANTVVVLCSQPQTADQQRRIAKQGSGAATKKARLAAAPLPPPLPRPVSGAQRNGSSEGGGEAGPAGAGEGSAAQAADAKAAAPVVHYVTGIVRAAPMNPMDAVAVDIHPACASHSGQPGAPCTAVLEALKQVRSATMLLLLCCRQGW